MATNNLGAVEAQIQKIREQTQEISKAVSSAQTTPAAPTTQQKKPASNNIEAIPVSSLQSPQSLIELPQQKPDTTDYSGIINDGATLSKVYGAGEQQQGEKTAGGLFDQYLGAMAANAPRDMTGDYNEMNAGLEDKQNAAIASKKNLEMLNAQLQGISDTATVQNLEMEKRAFAGGMNSPLFLSRQQAENSRQAAIASLPLQAQILAAQAQYTADNDTLLAAQDKVDKLFSIKSDYETRKQEYKQKLITSVFDYANEEQKVKLEAKAVSDKQAYEERQNKLKTAQEYAKMAIQNGQGAVAGLLMGLEADDPEFQTKLANYTAQIQDDSAALDRQYKQAQIAKIYGDMEGGGGKLLSPTEAAALGVPYGTTETQAAQMGITPQGKTTQAQQTVAGFATRLEQSSDILKSLESSIQKMNQVSFSAQMKIPWQGLKSDTIQQYDQAARNLINAILRRESGAVISDQEFDNARKQYLPLPGDSKKTLSQKRQNIEAVLANYRAAAGNAYSSVNDLMGGGNGSVIPFKSSSGKTYNLPY